MSYKLTWETSSCLLNALAWTPSNLSITLLPSTLEPVLLEETLESPLDCKEIQPVHPKGYQSWVSIGRTDAEAETPVLWPTHAKS